MSSSSIAFLQPLTIGHRSFISSATFSSPLYNPQRKNNCTHHNSKAFSIRKRTPSCTTTAPISISEDSFSQSPLPEGNESLRLYNTLTRQKDQFTTVEPGVVRFYSCGPTVYDYAHIGNFRAFLTYDIIKRWLLYKGYQVNHVMNLTDVDDKIIKKVEQLGCTAKELTTKYADAFFQDLDLLNIIKAQHYPRATDHITEIEDMVAGLKKRGFAYERDGSTYFSVASFETYGKLSQLEKREKGSLTNDNNINAQMDNDEYEKEDLRDFALWKAYKSEDGDVSWMTQHGKGRPGWHIECSCMAMNYLGPELDIHGGGIDLVFPHHENELAQSEAFSSRPFSRFWLHNGFVNIDNEKMSKSLGNFRTLRDIVKKPDDARAFRYMVVASQYRSALAFSEVSLKSAKSAVKRIDTLRKRLENVNNESENDGNIENIIHKATSDFHSAMDDDLNTPRAAASMFTVVNASEKLLKSEQMNKTGAEKVLKCLNDMDKVFGIFYTPKLGNQISNDNEKCDEQAEIPSELKKLLEERTAARKAKNFALADEIRTTISKAGFAIIDTPTGAKLEKLEN